MAKAENGSSGSGLLMSSGHIFMLARKSCERASTIDAYESLSAIILSTIALECFLNELEERLQQERFTAEFQQLGDLAFTLSGLEKERAAILRKIEAIHFFLTRRELDWGSRPYQDVKFLVTLRNALIHRRPEKIEHEFGNPDRQYESHKFVRYLVSRKIIEAPSPKSPAQWGAYVVCPPVAGWAYNTAVGTVSDIVAALPPSVFAETSKFMIQGMELIEQ